MKRILEILILFFLFSFCSSGQESNNEAGYQTMMMENPSLSGCEGDGVLRLSYINLYPGNNYNFHSVYFSYDSYFSTLHGGAGFYLSDDYMGGIVNDIRGGLSYAYFLRAGRDLFINAGLSASIYHRGYNFSNAVLPDQIDPLGGVIYPASEALSASGETVLDIGAGFLFISGKYFGGFSINHLTEPDPTGTGFYNERLKRKLLMHLSGEYDLNKEMSLKIRPVTFMSIQQKFISGGAGAVIENNLLSVNAILLGDNGKNMNMQTGFSLKMGKATFYYNYRFNIESGNSLLPFSLLHQAGLAISLNEVDKKSIIKTIKFPKM